MQVYTKKNKMQYSCINKQRYYDRAMFEHILKEHNINVTQQRIKILLALEEHSRPVTIDELYQGLVNDMNKTTLYRSLEAMVHAGIIYQTDFHEGVSYFEFQKHKHHHHLVCVECKNKQEVDYCPQIPFEKIFSEKGFVVNNHIFEIFGTCKNCHKQS